MTFGASEARWAAQVAPATPPPMTRADLLAGGMVGGRERGLRHAEENVAGRLAGVQDAGGRTEDGGDQRCT